MQHPQVSPKSSQGDDVVSLVSLLLVNTLMGLDWSLSGTQLFFSAGIFPTYFVVVEDNWQAPQTMFLHKRLSNLNHYQALFKRFLIPIYTKQPLGRQ